MCGLAGIHRRSDKAIPKLDALANALLLAIESRGTDATGFLAVLDSGKVQLEKRTRPASSFVTTRGRMHAKARTVLLHTRFATRGSAENPANAHPVVSGNMAAVHNGTIYNADAIFDAFQLPRMAEVDSEVIPAIISHAGWENASASFDLFEGGAATAVVNVEKPQEMILARTRSYPMVYAVTDDLVIFASTDHAIKRAWQSTYGKPLPVETQELGEWEMLLINGDLHHSRIRKVEAHGQNRPGAKERQAMKRPVPKRRKRPSITIPAKPAAPRASKAQRRRAKRNGSKTTTTTVSTLVATAQQAMPWDYLGLIEEDIDEGYYIETAIADLMREGFSRAEAWDAVHQPPTWADEVAAEEEIAWYGRV
jgi:asparagine synthetase B (glutamine-hydrolysing)